MTISAPLRPGIPNGAAAGPVRNDTMPSLTGAAGAADPAGCCACAGTTAATSENASSDESRVQPEFCDITNPSPTTRPLRAFIDGPRKRDPGLSFNRYLHIGIASLTMPQVLSGARPSA